MTIRSNTKYIIETDENGNAKYVTIKQAAEERNLNYDLVRKRMERGATLEEALAKEKYYNLRKVIDPETKEEITIGDLAKKYNIKTDTLHSRIFDLNWNVEKAISKDVEFKNKKKVLTSDLGDKYSYNKWDIALGYGRGVISHKRKRYKELSDVEILNKGNRGIIFFTNSDTGKIFSQDKVRGEEFVNKMNII